MNHNQMHIYMDHPFTATITPAFQKIVVRDLKVKNFRIGYPYKQPLQLRLSRRRH
jgi:hypothetical protein